MSAEQMVFSLVLTLATFVLVIVVACIMGPVFLYFFKSLLTYVCRFTGQAYLWD